MEIGWEQTRKQQTHSGAVAASKSARIEDRSAETQPRLLEETGEVIANYASLILGSSVTLHGVLREYAWKNGLVVESAVLGRRN